MSSFFFGGATRHLDSVVDSLYSKNPVSTSKTLIQTMNPTAGQQTNTVSSINNNNEKIVSGVAIPINSINSNNMNNSNSFDTITSDKVLTTTNTNTSSSVSQLSKHSMCLTRNIDAIHHNPSIVNFPILKENMLPIMSESSPQVHTGHIRKKSLVSIDVEKSPIVTEEPTTKTVTTALSADTFIDPVDLIKKLSNEMFIVLLDCRSKTDFNVKHIKDSVHLNCRDRITKKRLQSNKICVKDIISNEEIKSKLTNTSNEIKPIQPDILQQHSELPDGCTEMNRSLSSSSSSTTSSNDSSRDENDIIIIYDDKSSDVTDIQSDANPLKIVHENLKKSGVEKECKILKGGFQQFFQFFPNMCVNKKLTLQKETTYANYYDQQMDQHQSSIDNAVMTEIAPFLYLGNEVDCKNIEKLYDANVLYILNVTKNVPFYIEQQTTCPPGVKCLNEMKQKFKLKRLAVNDCSNQSLLEHFDNANEFIDEARKNGSKVLVHCQAGVSRSSSIVIAYLMSTKGVTMNEAYQQVKNERTIIAPNFIFMNQLMDYEKKLIDTKTTEDSTKEFKTACVDLFNSISVSEKTSDNNDDLSAKNSSMSNDKVVLVN